MKKSLGEGSPRLERLRELVTNENLTYEQKTAQIGTIMERFPQRPFILVGDTGEKDPEVYRAIKARFPARRGCTLSW